MRRLLILLLALGLGLFPLGNVVVAQCPMCKISAESNLNSGGTAGKGLNKGILYLFATPYLIIGGIGYVWYRNRRETAADERVELN